MEQRVPVQKLDFAETGGGPTGPGGSSVLTPASGCGVG